MAVSKALGKSDHLAAAQKQTGTYVHGVCEREELGSDGPLRDSL